MNDARVNANSDFLTIYAQLDALFKNALSASGLTVTQYRILLELDAAQPLHGIELAKMLMLEGSSITMAVAKLEELGLVVKTDEAYDRRSVAICLTDAGREVLASCTRLVSDQRERLWRGLNDAQRDVICRYTFGAAKNLKTSLMANDERNVTPYYVTSIEATIKLLSIAVKDGCGLSFTPFRVLYEMYLTNGVATGSAMAARLHIDKVLVSKAFATLSKRGFVEGARDPENKRSRVFCLTDAGRQMAEKGARIMLEAHDEIYSGLDDEVLAAVDEIAVTMVKNME